MVNLKSISIGTIIAGASAFAMGTAPAQAAWLGFDTTITTTPPAPITGPVVPKNDIRLNSFTKGLTTYSSFIYVTDAEIIENDHPLGPGSADHGDNTVTDIFLGQGPAVENPTAADVVAALGNNNLNSIIDTEDDKGTSIFDVYFGRAVKTFLFTERGMNSDLKVTAILSDGSLGNTFTITEDLWNTTGVRINTTEVNGAQFLGAYGLSYSENIIGLRLASYIGFNGPDYKVVGAVPEPMTMLGVGAAAAFGGYFKRKTSKKQNKNNA